ncbi:Farnesyl diphosphate synthase [Candidatus Ecksteinia adelgidicola]|nr:Farnesyl diphosphate synthase [Candidatus Ecksteinia adelgidicola]
MIQFFQSTIISTQLLNYHQRIEDTLLHFIVSPKFVNENLASAMHYSVFLGGKRFRPILVYIIGQMLGVTENNLDIPAAAIECIHRYSLIHDDLPSMDNDNLRRGLPSCHIKFNEANAILAGNALQALAFSILTDEEMPDVVLSDRLLMISELARATGIHGICSGQSMDLEAKGKKMNLKKIEQIYFYKTGSLIRAAIHLGALAAGNRGRTLLPLLNSYAFLIGLAFQIQDDILDIVGNSKIDKKSPSREKKQKESTYPYLFGLNNAKIRVQTLYQETLNILNCLEKKSFDTTLLKAISKFVVERDT